MHSPTCYAGYATGAVAHARQPADRRLEHFPGVCAQIAAGLPDSFDLSPKVQQIYQQGDVPCCVVASLALCKSLQDMLDRRCWNMYEFLEAYHAVGGNDRDGVPARAALEYARATGLRISGREERHRIGSYAFTPQDSTLFVQTLKGALAGSRPCVLACRLPEQFGWDSSGPATEAYHQLALVGFDAQHAIVANSWGRGWGRLGFGRLPWDYLTADNLQRDDCYAYTLLDDVPATT